MGGMDLTHTIVPKPISGRGVAGDIVEFVLDYAIKNNLKIRPTCSYVKLFIEAHKGVYGALVDQVDNSFPSLNVKSGHACGIKKPND